MWHYLCLFKFSFYLLSLLIYFFVLFFAFLLFTVSFSFCLSNASFLWSFFFSFSLLYKNIKTPEKRENRPFNFTLKEKLSPGTHTKFSYLIKCLVKMVFFLSFFFTTYVQECLISFNQMFEVKEIARIKISWTTFPTVRPVERNFDI